MLWSAFRDSCLHAFANRQCKASLAGPTIHEQQPLFSRETWLIVGMWLVTIWNLLCQTHTKLSVTLPRLGINQSIYMTSDAHKILLDSFLWSKHPFTHVYTCSVPFCSLQSIVLAPPKFRKLRSMSKCPDSQNITTESVGKCSAFKRCDPAQSCTWWTCLAINPASKIEDLCFIEWVVRSPCFFDGHCCSSWFHQIRILDFPSPTTLSFFEWVFPQCLLVPAVQTKWRQSPVPTAKAVSSTELWHHAVHLLEVGQQMDLQADHINYGGVINACTKGRMPSI